jgi:hypothetical protein
VSRILFAWELGGGFGHLGPFLPVAKALLARGHQLTVAARDVERAQIVFGALPVHIVQAPLCAKTYNGLSEPPLNYAEILMRYGYLDAPLLAGLLSAWRGLLDLSAADVLLADHAPTALLAARGGRAARLAMGTPFAVPPAVRPTPNMRDWVPVPAERLARSDEAVLAVINRSLGDGTPRLTALHEIFHEAGRLLLGVPELDHFGPREAGSYLGLHAGMIGRAAPSWPAGGGPRVFAYLSGEFRHIDAALAALAGSGARCVVFLLGAAAQRDKHRGPNMVFSEELLDVDCAASECDVAVCHANLGTVIEVMRKGKPLLLLPMDLEKFLLARNIEKLGAGELVHPDAPAPDFAGTLKRLLESSRYAEAARAFAARHRDPPVDTIVQRAVERIESLAAGGRA